MAQLPILACDLGGTRLRVALVDSDGTVRSKEALPTPREEPTALAETIRSVLDRSGASVAGAVVGIPGAVDYFRGEPLRLPNLPQWEGQVSADKLSRELGFPVFLANDADLAALGEHRFGAGRGSRDMVYVTSSTGVGAGVVINGRLLHGRISLAEVGHTIIDRTTGATVESLGSGTALARLSGDDAAAVGNRARAGDLEASAQFAQVAHDFAVGVFNLVHSFSPEIVVVGGGMAQAGDLLLGPVRAMLGQCDSSCPAALARVAGAEGGDDVGLRGAASYWADRQDA